MSRISDIFLFAALGGVAIFIGTLGAGQVQRLGADKPNVPANSAPAQPAAGQTAAAAPRPATPKPAAAAAKTELASSVPSVPDVAAGEKVFAKCKACHSVKDDGKSGTGPNLYGVFNRAPGSIDGFKFSDSMKGVASSPWDGKHLDAYLADPKATVPGNKMAFAGLKATADRANVIAFLASKSATPIAPDALGLTVSAAAASPAASAEPAAPAAPEVPQIAYVDPPSPTAEQAAAENDAVAALKAVVDKLDYQRARYYPLHFKGAIEKATNSECLVCHQEILETKVREASPAGLKSADSLAWYQTLATYDGAQQTFHQRHMTTPYAQAVMNLNCNFCHKGYDPREESPDMQPGITIFPAKAETNFTLRKMVNPSETCLLCHGPMPDPVNIMGLPGSWHEARVDLETPDAPNACLTCHAETFRTNRHNVNYLKAASIEDIAKEGSDVCFGCHGGRAWYRISYPYPRHPWPGMDPATPDWAKGRPAQSKPEYQLPAVAAQ